MKITFENFRDTILLNGRWCKHLMLVSKLAYGLIQPKLFEAVQFHHD